MATKKEQIAQEVARAVGAGKAVAMETVDFSDPNRPKTCLEVDFPLSQINSVASLEASSGALKKPIYQMSKWWARRQSSVFRSMLIAAATKAPEDPSHAAKLVWDNYYANHQKKGAFKHLKVADIFMGGGTTLVEGSRLGMQMSGNDLNPVAWFVVKQELADVDLDEVQRLLAEIEAEVKPQIMPFYYCDGPNGEKGTWKHKLTGKIMGDNFDPLCLPPEERAEYHYDGPEIIYTYWAKHGPCQVTGCGHRTPFIASPVVATKALSVKSWEHTCVECGTDFDIEASEARMSPNASMVIASGERPFAVIDAKGGFTCPTCGHSDSMKLGKSKNKKVNLSLLVGRGWLDGSSNLNSDEVLLGGAPQDEVSSTCAWFKERARFSRLIEVRGALPETIICPETGKTIHTGKTGGNVPKKANFTCASCGTQQPLLEAVRATEKAAPSAPYAVQAYTPRIQPKGFADHRYYLPFGDNLAQQLCAASKEWETRKHGDLSDYWPRTGIPEGVTTTYKDVLPNGHGYHDWWMLFNSRQLLVLALLLKAIETVGSFEDSVRDFVLGAFQQFLRCNNALSIWHMRNNQISAALSNSNFNTKNTSVEPSVFGPVGDGGWRSATRGLVDALTWKKAPWELVSVENLRLKGDLEVSDYGSKSVKALTLDPIPATVIPINRSSTELSHISSQSIDLVITDPPFGDNIQYAELSDFFYVWLQLVLSKRYKTEFSQQLTNKSLEAVTNVIREGNDADDYYKRLLTQCWKEAARILKPGGVLAFTFHHSEDEPWVAVLESLFEAGFYLEATYPVRSDESKGDTAQFGSQKIEYDVIHVCRQRTKEPKPVSWARMRREVLADVRQLQGLLENHARRGLPEADIQVIRRGKALEYFSQHYGKVYVDEGRPISVKDALVGINQLIDEDANKASEPPPVTAEPITRQFLRIFDGKTELARDQMQKMLRGSGIAPDEFVSRGWAREEKKVFYLNDPLVIAQDWQGRHRRKLSADLDQTFVLMGACYDGSGINAADTLKNENFKPHAALKSLLEWMSKRGQTQQMRNAASRALSIYNNWAASNKEQVQQLSFFLED